MEVAWFTDGILALVPNPRASIVALLSDKSVADSVVDEAGLKEVKWLSLRAAPEVAVETLGIKPFVAVLLVRVLMMSFMCVASLFGVVPGILNVVICRVVQWVLIVLDDCVFRTVVGAVLLAWRVLVEMGVRPGKKGKAC